MKALDWLLDSSNPTSRLLALKLLLDNKDADPAVVAAREAIPTSPWIRTLMRDRHPDGWWGDPKNLATPKFTGTMFRLEALADLGMPGDDPRVKGSIELFMERTLLPGEGFCARQTPPRTPHECGQGRMLFVFNHFGYGSDPRVKASAQWLLANQMLDGGWNCSHNPKGRLQADGVIRMSHRCSLDMPHHRSSLFTTMAVLKGLGTMKRPPRAAIKRGVEFLLEHNLYRSKRTGRAVYGWPMPIAFPPISLYDGLQPLRVLAMLGTRYDERMDEALGSLAARADRQGRWVADGAPMPPSKKPELTLKIAEAGKPNKWVTVHALAVLRSFGWESAAVRITAKSSTRRRSS